MTTRPGGGPIQELGVGDLLLSVAPLPIHHVSAVERDEQAPRIEVRTIQREVFMDDPGRFREGNLDAPTPRRVGPERPARSSVGVLPERTQ